MRNKKGCIFSILLGCFIIGVSIPLFMTNHKKVKADTISDLTNTTWELHSNLGTFPGWNYYNINFTTNEQSMTSFAFDGGDFVGLYYSGNKVYSYNKNPIGWTNDAYRTIVITGGTDASNSNLISWLQSNATQQASTTQITHKYWSPYGVITLTDNQLVQDENIEYTILYNEFTNTIYETPQTGLIFYNGYNTGMEMRWSYIFSVDTPNNINLYNGPSNNINNAMWLEFTYGDRMASELYDFMDLWGYWFDDGDAYIVGMNQGYAEGTQHGIALGQADGIQYTSLITNIFNGIGSLLNIQVFPNITIGLLIGLPLLLGVLVIILKILRG